MDRRQRVTMGLERIERLLSLLDDPHRKLRVVQVVGTNGKGTTAVAMAGALSELGQPAGAYLSPHVLSYTERVMVGGEPVSEKRFAAAMSEAMEVSDAHGIEASQFELLTAGAIKLFADEGLRWAVLEAGLGARHDATTAGSPEAVVLTNVGLDHAEYLGDTVEEISGEKLASVSPGSTLILGTADPVVRRIAAARCEEVGARLVEAGGADPGGLEGLPPYAVRDATLGSFAAEALARETLPEQARRWVLRDVVGALPARFEAHEVDGVPVVVDGGHNAAGVDAALEAMAEAYGSRPFAAVFGVLRGKDVASMLAALRRTARVIVLTRPEGERASDAADVLREHGAMAGGEQLVVGDPVEAVGRAVREAGRFGGVVLVLGSFRVAAPVLRWLREG